MIKLALYKFLKKRMKKIKIKNKKLKKIKKLIRLLLKKMINHYQLKE